MKLSSTFGGALLAALISMSPVQATTLSGTLTADNAFSAYLSTNDAVLGTLIASGADWTQDFSISPTVLTPGVTHYLHVVAQDLGEIFMFMGQFSLSDGNFEFANSTQSLLTNTTDWNANLYSGVWFAPSGTPQSFGTNPPGCCGNPWGRATMIGAEFIWASGGFPFSAAAFSTAIIPDAAAVPLPATLPLFVTGLAALSLLARRRKKQAAA